MLFSRVWHVNITSCNFCKMFGAVKSDQVCRFKGKIINKNELEKRQAKQNLIKQLSARRKEMNQNKENNNNSCRHNNEDKKNIVTGSRIVDISLLGKNLICRFCQKVLSLLCIEVERRIGLNSDYDIRCHHCLRITTVSTSNYILPPNGDSRCRMYDINLGTVLGKYFST